MANTRKMSAGTIEKEIKSLTRLYNQGVLSAEQHKLKFDELFLNLDITSRKHQGNSESKAAYENSATKRENQRKCVYNLLKSGPKTMKEIADLMGVQLNTVSGRGSELKILGYISPTGERRKGSAVLALTEKVY